MGIKGKALIIKRNAHVKYESSTANVSKFWQRLIFLEMEVQDKLKVKVKVYKVMDPGVIQKGSRQRTIHAAIHELI